MTSTRSKSEIYLIGKAQPCFDNRQLPTIIDVLKVYFHYHLNLKKSQKDSVQIVVQSVCELWVKASIPIAEQRNITRRLSLLLMKYRNLSRNKCRKTSAQIARALKFKDEINMLFDIAQHDALSIIKIEEDKLFLIDQRSDRKFIIGGVDVKSSEQERIKAANVLKIMQRHKKEELRKKQALETIDLPQSSSDEESDNVRDLDDEFIIKQKNASSIKIKTPEILSKNLAFALDRTGTSNSKAAYILSAAAQTLNLPNASDHSLSVSSIRRRRTLLRSQHASNIKSIFFCDVPLVVHFDGKLLPAISGGPTKEDRIAIVVSGIKTEKLIEIPKIEKGTGKQISEAVIQALVNWNISNHIVGMSFDTTATNTGCLKGACVLIEKRLQKKLLWLACRHHIMEIMCGEVFKKLFGATSGPDVKLFNSFREFWPNIDQSKYEICVDSRLSNELHSLKEDTVAFAKEMLKKDSGQLFRGDYRELLELTLIFLGETPPRGISFRTPGAFHHARWMSKLLYVLKCYLFRKQFSNNDLQDKAVLDFSIFIAVIYVKAWIQCPNACDAPFNDLNLLKKISEFMKISKVISQTATAALRRHLWYLSEELSPLAFFSDLVPNETKRLMVDRLRANVPTISSQKYRSVRYKGTNELSNQTVASFLGSASHNFFEIMKIDMGFLNADVESWADNDKFTEAKKKVIALKVVNDSAERAIALATSFNQSLTTDENQKQYVFQVVEDHRKRFPNSNKKTLFLSDENQ